MQASHKSLNHYFDTSHKRDVRPILVCFSFARRTSKARASSSRPANLSARATRSWEFEVADADADANANAAEEVINDGVDNPENSIHSFRNRKIFNFLFHLPRLKILIFCILVLYCFFFFLGFFSLHLAFSFSCKYFSSPLRRR